MPRDEQGAQGLRWLVFKQDSPKKRHQAVGSVHAADADHALVCARHVFVRRPSASSLWLVNEQDVYARPEELQAISNSNDDLSVEKSYVVFCKFTHKRAMTYVEHIGEVSAISASKALEKAQEHFDAALVWWLVPEDALIKSETYDEDAWFAPAKYKTYRQQSTYGLVKHLKKTEP